MGFEHTSSMTGPSLDGHERAHGNVVIRERGAVSFVVHGFQVDGHGSDLDERERVVSATCGNNLAVAGTAEATLAGQTITWSAAGNATSAGLPTCPITLTGTAELGTDSIRVPYSGDTCLGKVSGVEVLKRH